jgi:hypothetical protein
VLFGPENTPYLYGSFAVNDVVLLFLYWLLYHAPTTSWKNYPPSLTQTSNNSLEQQFHQ